MPRRRSSKCTHVQKTYTEQLSYRDTTAPQDVGHTDIPHCGDAEATGMRSWHGIAAPSRRHTPRSVPPPLQGPPHHVPQQLPSPPAFTVTHTQSRLTQRPPHTSQEHHFTAPLPLLYPYRGPHPVGTAGHEALRPPTPHRSLC